MWLRLRKKLLCTKVKIIIYKVLTGKDITCLRDTNQAKRQGRCFFVGKIAHFVKCKNLGSDPCHLKKWSVQQHIFDPGYEGGDKRNAGLANCLSQGVTAVN